ncbi:MAG: glycosyltransferase family 4 protein [Gammaproteobacteria bacterium]|nr:glycosyltransferase family 4 protein [Gammaproteobacteria bacterium]
MNKILYIHHAIGMGGAPRSLSMLIAGLNRTRFEPIVVMPKRSGNKAVKSLFLDAGAKVIEEIPVRPFNGSQVAPCATMMEKAYALTAFPLLAQLTKRLTDDLEPDIVHLNSTCLVAAARGVATSRYPCPTIAHVREPLLPNRWGRLLASLNRRYVNYYIAIDEAGLASIGDNIANGTVVRNFVDTKKFYPNAKLRGQLRNAYGWGADDVVFLLLSRIAHSNGVLELIDHIEAESDELNKAAHFVIAGFEGNGTDYSNEARRRIDAHQRCQMLPFINDVPGLLNAADVVVAPYLTSHSARCIFEGGGVGKPALVSRLPNLMEQIKEGETGISFDLSEPVAFRNAVNRFCDPIERARLGVGALNFTATHFSAETNIARTEDVYERLLNP